MKLFCLLFGLLLSSAAFGGGQQYTKLKNETQSLMSKSIVDNPPLISSFDSEVDEKLWIFQKEKNLRKRFPIMSDRVDLLKSVHYEAVRAGLDPELILGLIEVESGFQKYAVSSVGARGYMQVMPFWIGLIGNKDHNLFNMRTNLRYGCTILRHYLDRENGNIKNALARYNGSLGKDGYPNMVFAAFDKKWKN